MDRFPILLLSSGALAIAGGALAEQPATDTTAPYAVDARLNFRIVYPAFLRFRVGTAGATINTLTFAVPVANVGDSTAIAATGGDTGGGSALNVEVAGNNGQVTITATNSSGGLGIGTGRAADGRISYDQIATTTSDPQLPAPLLTNAGGTTSQPALSSSLVTKRAAVWSFAYLNQILPSAGSYGGSAARGGRVTYTAAMP
ncbi:MAG: hypothetical protein IPP91_15045 [Betaproteobacteria bacterium]|nr:hypothetical protein [Betaproteobacteria bacterium]